MITEETAGRIALLHLRERLKEIDRGIERALAGEEASLAPASTQPRIQSATYRLEWWGPPDAPPSTAAEPVSESAADLPATDDVCDLPPATDPQISNDERIRLLARSVAETHTAAAPDPQAQESIADADIVTVRDALKMLGNPSAPRFYGMASEMQIKQVKKGKPFSPGTYWRSDIERLVARYGSAPRLQRKRPSIGETVAPAVQSAPPLRLLPSAGELVKPGKGTIFHQFRDLPLQARAWAEECAKLQPGDAKTTKYPVSPSDAAVFLEEVRGLLPAEVEVSMEPMGQYHRFTARIKRKEDVCKLNAG